MKPPKLTLEKVSEANINYEFIGNVVAKFFKILFRADKKIKLIYSNYSKKNFLNDNVVILNFRFKNAIWYKIDSKITERRQFVVPKPHSSEKLILEVYGFFSKKTYVLNFDEEIYSNEREFCVELKKAYPFKRPALN